MSNTVSGMKKPTRIHGGAIRQPRRPHFIEAWAVHRGYKDQAALVDALGADKSVVSRWYSGASPGAEWQVKLGQFFGDEEDPADIFRHPDDDWLAKFFQGRRDEEITRMKQMLEAAFPPASKARNKG